MDGLTLIGIILLHFATKLFRFWCLDDKSLDFLYGPHQHKLIKKIYQITQVTEFPKKPKTGTFSSSFFFDPSISIHQARVIYMQIAFSQSQGPKLKKIILRRRQAKDLFVSR